MRPFDMDVLLLEAFARHMDLKSVGDSKYL